MEETSSCEGQCEYPYELSGRATHDAPKCDRLETIMRVLTLGAQSTQNCWSRSRIRFNCVEPTSVLFFRLSMILSENRFPLFGIMPDGATRSALSRPIMSVFGDDATHLSNLCGETSRLSVGSRQGERP
jgi:hypothetical protein